MSAERREPRGPSPGPGGRPGASGSGQGPPRTTSAPCSLPPWRARAAAAVLCYINLLNYMNWFIIAGEEGGPQATARPRPQNRLLPEPPLQLSALGGERSARRGIEFPVQPQAGGCSPRGCTGAGGEGPQVGGAPRGWGSGVAWLRTARRSWGGSRAQTLHIPTSFLEAPWPTCSSSGYTFTYSFLYSFEIHPFLSSSRIHPILAECPLTVGLQTQAGLGPLHPGL